ncbi:DUF1080 domain-containing protein [Echinicola strongylocentroti]|uniref:DUF1080 domain-containing protein n=1 Tax=Echinicola strongylocentroti TaxID=1795355 RepID=A0A2Z4IGD1_9BACT|nr:DUF1080 domain-containing protein [Echinicola strongylocentroti]AWW30211.1 DUF1080 domain-containing protein [Echinicola strongylocentroti]
MKNKLLLAVACCVLAGVSCSSPKGKSKEIPVQEWQSLFDGESLDGWVPKIHHHETGENYRNTFRVKDDAILVSYDEYNEGFDERYGHLFYEQPYATFHLKWEYRFTEEWLEDAPSYTYRNSGVMFHSQSPESILKEQDWPISVEYQMLAEAEAGVERPTGNMCSPGTEVYYEGEMDPRHCINSTSATYPWDEWVKADLIVFEDSLVIHMVNGDTVLRYTQPQIGGGVANGYDPAIKVDGKLLKEGYIGLQSEGQGVMFRNIQIKDLSTD